MGARRDLGWRARWRAARPPDLPGPSHRPAPPRQAGAPIATDAAARASEDASASDRRSRSTVGRAALPRTLDRAPPGRATPPAGRALRWRSDGREIPAALMRWAWD